MVAGSVANTAARAALRVVVGLLLAYTTSLQATVVVDRAYSFLPSSFEPLRAYIVPLLVLAVLVYSVLRPYGHVFLVPIAVTVAGYVVSPLTVTRLWLHGLLIGAAFILSALLEKFEVERNGSMRRDLECGVRCVAISIASQATVYAALIGISYYVSVLVESVYASLLTPRGTGLFYEVWSLSASSVLVQSILFFSVVVVIYVFASRVVLPFTYVLVAPRNELDRLVEGYVRREAEAVREKKKWYHVIMTQSIGFAVAFPAALIAYAASLLLPSLPLLSGRLGGVDETALSIAIVAIVGSLAYYAGKRFAMYFLLSIPSWRKAFYAGLFLLAGAALVLVALWGPSGLAYLTGVDGNETLTAINYRAASIEKTIASSVESSEKLLEIVVKILWG